MALRQDALALPRACEIDLVAFPISLQIASLNGIRPIGRFDIGGDNLADWRVDLLVDENNVDTGRVAIDGSPGDRVVGRGGPGGVVGRGDRDG